MNFAGLHCNIWPSHLSFFLSSFLSATCLWFSCRLRSVINIFPSSCAGFREVPWESLHNCLPPNKDVMCRRASLSFLSLVSLLLAFLFFFFFLLQSPPRLCIFPFWYRSHESLLLLIWFCGRFICRRRRGARRKPVEAFHRVALAAGAATGQCAINSKNEVPCSPRHAWHTQASMRVRAHTHVSTLPQWNKTILLFDPQTSQLTFSLNSLPLSFFIYRGLNPPSPHPPIIFLHSLIWWANLISKWIPSLFIFYFF